jgi:hypothetical protein
MIRLHPGDGSNISNRKTFKSTPFPFGGTTYINHNLGSDCCNVTLIAHSDGSSVNWSPQDYYRDDYLVVRQYYYNNWCTDLNTVRVTFYHSSAPNDVVAYITAGDPYPR